MKCGTCEQWKLGVPCGVCNHPEGNYQFTSDKMVFEYVTEANCPKMRNMINAMNNLMRIDYETKLGDIPFKHTVVFNKTAITEEEVKELIKTGMTEYDERVIEISPEQFEMIFKGQNKPSNEKCNNELNEKGNKKATIQELKSIIVDLKVSLARAKVPQGHCPYAYISIDKDKPDCNYTDCNICEKEFFKEYGRRRMLEVEEL